MDAESNAETEENAKSKPIQVNKFYLISLIVLVGLLIGLSTPFLPINKILNQYPKEVTNKPYHEDVDTFKRNQEIAEHSFSTPVPSPPSVMYKPTGKEPKTKVYFNQNSDLKSLDLSTGEVKTLIDLGVGWTIRLSNSKDKISYTNNTDYSYEDKEDINMMAYVYDLKQKQSTLIHSGHGYQYTEADWSPDDKYILIDEGTGPYRAKTLVDVATKNKIIEFGSSGHRILWVNDHEFIFTASTDMLDFQYLDDGGCPCDIVSYDIRTQKKIKIKQADSKTSYRSLGLTNDGKIVFEKAFYKDGVSRNLEDASRTSWIQNSDGTETQTNDPEKITTGLDSGFRLLIDNKEIKYRFFSPKKLSNEPEWIIFNISSNQVEDNAKAEGVYITNLKDPQKFLTKIFSKEIHIFDW